jgi:diguanylate cyclase (GGDEF)-like protein
VRYGGEEFVILLADTPLKNAYIFAERLRRQVEKSITYHNGFELKYTISLGIAEIEQSMKSYEEWVSCADAALYNAKETGRNKIGMHPKSVRK